MQLIKSLIRSVIAMPKIPHYCPDLHLKLDLSYITPQIIVSSAPTTTYIESWYRYPLSDLLTYLNHTHGDEWRFYNFRGEEAGYVDEDVDGRVHHYPFPDHFPPSFEIMISCVADIHEFINGGGGGRVVVLHCKAGKGRSGTLCCAYLMYERVMSGRSVDVEEVVREYTRKRMKVFGGAGVSILSQRRYLGYFERYLLSMQRDMWRMWGRDYMEWRESGVEYRVAEVVFRGLRVDQMGFSLSDYVVVEDGEGRENTVVNTLIVESVRGCGGCGGRGRDGGDDDVSFEFEQRVSVGPDVMIRVERLCYLWFNIYFEVGQEAKVAEFTWDEFDGFKGTRHRGNQLFDSVEIHFELEMGEKEARVGLK
ncbi:uncharacterized protein LODBEIA_P60270 [Lodderomyces beijingensis]|uniref:phosphatidylinositol-3,4,5-trisphosphate 3-phosphatase n=1 Tax=Lodderomyces beijingensis TaxID=1775926 RepID=A0ABP0ZUI7_9ASCO